MTESQWLTTTDAKWLLCRAEMESSLRQVGYFHVACCRVLCHEWAPHDTIWNTLQQVESALDNGLSVEKEAALCANLVAWHQRVTAALRRAVEEARGRKRHFVRDQSLRTAAIGLLAEALPFGKEEHRWWRIETQIDDPMLAAQYAALEGRLEQVCSENIAILHDVFGNPFRPVAFAPEWRTSTATALAQQMYESRDFGAMPILADALQDAGCDSDDILNHCRNPEQVHVRGCWVVDLVLGKG